ncbi:MAG: hypothetical protein SF066_23655 [Thermoanaerobaculia bacterium]|nr:hypothetical protein [Thermoanaerobaculia bacterium]
MPMPPRRVLLLLLLLALTPITGIWVGERFSLTWNPLPAVIPVFLTLAATIVSWRFHRGVALAAGVFSFALFAVGYLMGSREVALVFNDCLHDGERVREKLERHRQQNGAYPGDLAELGPGIPGDLLFSRPLLRYQRTPTGYELVFRDALVTHRATESKPLQASK